MPILNITDQIIIKWSNATLGTYNNTLTCLKFDECSNLCQESAKIAVHNSLVITFAFIAFLFFVITILLKFKPDYLTWKDGLVVTMICLVYAVYLYLMYGGSFI